MLVPEPHLIQTRGLKVLVLPNVASPTESTAIPPALVVSNFFMVGKRSHRSTGLSAAPHPELNGQNQ